MRFLRPLITVYGAGVVGTFAWLFFALSGLPACAGGLNVCLKVFALTGQIALTWPAYWSGRLTGSPMAQPMIPVETVLAPVLAFLAVVLFAKVYKLFDVDPSKRERAEALLKTLEPNRRNQSAVPRA